MAVCTEAEFRSATERLDKDFNLIDERSHPVLEPFLPAFTVTLPLERGTITMHLRLIEPERRDQAEQVMAGLINEAPQLVHERLDRALAAARACTAEPVSGLYFGASCSADGIAPLLPPGLAMREIPIAGVPGIHERIFIIQGDAPETDGLLSLMTRRLATSLGGDGEWVAATLRKHAERIRAITSERDYRLHQVVFEPQRYERFVTGLSTALSRLGQPTTRLDVESALAKARLIADRAWAGQTHLDPIPIIRDISHAMAIRLASAANAPPLGLRKQYEETEDPLPGLNIAVDLGREYPFPGSATHLVGTIARTADPERGSSLMTWTGLTGLEQTYDALLRGAPGIVMRSRTPDGLVTIRETAPEAGLDLRTELDMEVQTTAEDALAHWYELAEQLGTATPKMDKARAVGKGRAGFVLMDCHTGALLACASAPGFTMQDYSIRYQELLKAPGEPLRNWAADAETPPGSSMKICTALAGLEYGTLNPGERIHTLGYMAMINGRKILRDHAEAGDYDLPHAIQVSSNCYFATVAARTNRTDSNRVSEVAARFGLGQRNTLDVPGQRPGILPTPAMLARQKRKWQPSDSWFLGIGQNLTASPVQVVCIAAAVANGGHIVRPYLVRPSQPEVKDLHIRKEWLDEVRHGMELVTENLPHSTAKYLTLEGTSAGIKVAAKTGTSEWGSEAQRERGEKPDHAWMIGYAPADNPTVAFACFIHAGTSGGAATTGVVKRTLECYFTKYGRAGHARGDKKE
jgi:penicillin-binding protein 2